MYVHVAVSWRFGCINVDIVLHGVYMIRFSYSTKFQKCLRKCPTYYHYTRRIQRTEREIRSPNSFRQTVPREMNGSRDLELYINDKAGSFSSASTAGSRRYLDILLNAMTIDSLTVNSALLSPVCNAS